MREVLERHQRICDDLYQLALEENQFLQTKRRPTSPEIMDRKRALLDQLTQNLEALKTSIAPEPSDAKALADLKDKVRQRILQIIHLDRDNEKLLLKYSLPSRGPSAPPPPAGPAAAGNLARLYGKVLPPR